jgi:hypothetical protein
LDYFTSNLFDFAYAEDLGTFLLRVKYWFLSFFFTKKVNNNIVFLT